MKKTDEEAKVYEDKKKKDNVEILRVCISFKNFELFSKDFSSCAISNSDY